MNLLRDLRHALRTFRKSPGFALLAVLTLALGIGANAAIFGVVKSVLLDALPYPESDRLVRVHGHFLDGSSEQGPLSAGTVRDIAERQSSFEVVGASATGPWEAFYSAGRAGADTEVVRMLWIQPEQLEALRVAPAFGRGFVAEDARDTAQVVLLSHATWRQRFGGERDVLGQVIRINDLPRTVVGVLPRGFVPPVGEEADFYLPLSLAPSLRDPVQARARHWLGLVGRLKRGVDLERAEAELAAIGRDLARQHAENEGIRVTAMPLREAMVGDTRTPLLVLMASAALVLLIACANLAAAFLSRTISRRKELAVRVSLGASRGRLVQQLLTESALLGLIGGASGLLLALGGLAVLEGAASPALPAYADISVDGGIVLWTFLVALCTGLAFGAGPALSATRADPHEALGDQTRGASESRRSRRMRGWLVAGQVALCLSLLAGAGLLARSLWQMVSTPYGFDPDRVTAATIPLPSSRYDTPESRVAFQRQFEERLHALPEVAEVAMTSQLPTRVGERNGFSIQGRPWASEEATPFVLTAGVSDDYFGVLRIPLRDGRTFSPADHLDAPPVVVISEAMARRYWPQGNAVGARIRMGPDPEAPWMEVVGVVGDVRNDLAAARPEPMAYTSLRQAPWGDTYLLRTARDPAGMADAVRRELSAVDASVPLQEVTTLRAVIGEGLLDRRLPVLLVGVFGALALILAAVGVYAMFANMAAARRREFGIRMALGSERGAIAGLVVREGAVWMALGLAGGVLGILAVSRALDDLLFGVAPFDPLALGAALLLLVVSAAAALLVPVRRATRVDPLVALRSE